MRTGLHARSWRITAIAMAILLGLGILPGLASPGAVAAQADELSQRDFDDLVDAAQETDPIYGPEDGELAHDPELVTLSYAEIETADFLATVTFSNPYAGANEQFDYGFQFRTFDDADGVHYLRFLVISTTDWGITDTNGDIVVQGVYDNLDVSRRGENELILYAQGNLVHLGINGDYVGSAEVDLEDAGDVAVGTSFFTDSFQEGASSEFFEFTVWELPSPGSERDDEPLGRRDDEPTPDEGDDDPTPTDEDGDRPPSNDEETSTPESDEPTATEEPAPEDEQPTATEAIERTRYESPTYGYAVEYDESWTVRYESSTDASDLIEIGNGASVLQFLGFESGETPNECIATLIARLRISEAVASAEIALDENDEEMRGEGETEAFVELTVTYAGETGDPVVFGIYYGCYQIADRALLQVMHLALVDQYTDEIDNRAAVLATLDLDGDGEPDVDSTPVEDDPTPADDEETTTPAGDDPTPSADDPTPADELPEGAVAIYLGSTTDANTSVIGTMVPAGARAEIVLFVLLGEPGAEYMITINTGSCTAPGPVEFQVGAVDANGLVEATVGATVEELSSGDYIMVVAADSAPDDPVACGNLADMVE